MWRRPTSSCGWIGSGARPGPRAGEMAGAGRSFDHLIRPRQQRRRDREAEGLGGLDVDDELELGGLLDWEIGGSRAPEDLIDVSCGTPSQVEETGTIPHEPAPRAAPAAGYRPWF